MTGINKEELKLEIGDTGEVWSEVVGVLEKHDNIPCDFCNHENNTAERGTINADYILKIGHSGCAYVCDYCINPSIWR